jgi:thiol-disulfide isomerase/thioredoxin
MKRIIVLLLYAVFCFTKTQSQDIPTWKIDDLEKFIKQSTKPTVVNFWATYCKPCIEEIPHFQKLVKEYEADSVQLLLVSLDMEEMYPAAIKSFAERFKFTAPIAFLNETNADIFCPRVDEKWSGAIPATLFVNNNTGYRKFFEKAMSEQSFEAELKNVIGTKTNKKPRYLAAVIIFSLLAVVAIVLWYNQRNAKN